MIRHVRAVERLAASCQSAVAPIRRREQGGLDAELLGLFRDHADLPVVAGRKMTSGFTERIAVNCPLNS